MASKGKGSIGISGFVFWIIMGYCFFGGNDKSDNKKVDIVENDKPDIVEKIKNGVNNVKPEFDAAIKKAKNELENIKKEMKEEAEKPKKNVTENPKSNNRFERKDIYGNDEDKW